MATEQNLPGRQKTCFIKVSKHSHHAKDGRNMLECLNIHTWQGKARLCFWGVFRNVSGLI